MQTYLIFTQTQRMRFTAGYPWDRIVDFEVCERRKAH
jgi:hypothetical protein